MDNRQYSPGGFSILPPIVKNLLIINGIFYLATISLGYSMNIDLIDILGLHYFKAEKFEFYQFITYMFMHGGFSHIFFNMFALWMFGSILEQTWGPKRFLIYYFFTGIGAAIVHYVVFYFQITPTIELIDNFIYQPNIENLQQIVSTHRFAIYDDTGNITSLFEQFKINYSILANNPTDTAAMQNVLNFMSEYKIHYLNQPVVVGASGAVYGLLLAFGMMFPNAMIYLYFFVPMKAKWFVIIFGVIELLSGIYGRGGNIAHFAHLGGMIFGIILILIWRRKDKKSSNFSY